MSLLNIISLWLDTNWQIKQKYYRSQILKTLWTNKA